jgi:hypothetical protein
MYTQRGDFCEKAKGVLTVVERHILSPGGIGFEIVIHIRAYAHRGKANKRHRQRTNRRRGMHTDAPLFCVVGKKELPSESDSVVLFFSQDGWAHVPMCYKGCAVFFLLVRSVSFFLSAL